MHSKTSILIVSGTLLILVMLIFPLPTLMMDILIALNILFALTILIVVLHTREKSDFSLQPTLLLISIIFNMAVYITTGRLILTRGAEFDGRLIRLISFLFSGSGNIVYLYIGLVIFAVIFSIFLLVITKGATRIAEVAARFTLDTMQVNLMAIEAEYNSGKINKEYA